MPLYCLVMVLWKKVALCMLLAKPRPADRALVPRGAPADLWTAQPEGGEWAGGPLQDKLNSGWASAHGFAAPARPPGAPAAFALGPEAAAMLSDASYLERVLQWLVTDHKEADDAAGTGGGGLAALLSAQRQPHDVLCAGLRALPIA